MTNYSVPPDITAVALRDAKESDPSELLEYDFEHQVIFDAEFMGKPFHGFMKLRRYWRFLVLEDGSVAFDDHGVDLVSENFARGQLKKNHEEECGHPMGSGNPCGWCALQDAARELMNACRRGDVTETIDKMIELEAHL